MRWMKLEPILQSEVSQKENHQYSILTYIYEFRKMVMITLYVRQQETQMYRMDFWTLRERERVGWFGRIALKHVYYHVRNESPVQVRCRVQDACGYGRKVLGELVTGKSKGSNTFAGDRLRWKQQLSISLALLLTRTRGEIFRFDASRSASLVWRFGLDYPRLFSYGNARFTVIFWPAGYCWSEHCLNKIVAQ